jgi:hypothetical protein
MSREVPSPALRLAGQFADPRVVNEPQLDPFARMLGRGGGYLIGKPSFLKTSCASGPFAGGRAAPSGLKRQAR